ncbi:MAG: ribosome small subunit-dependent GTPase A [Lachnospiraceae bacterium]|nr:ribosome small subunit-dependent GTPase A [Lachnospiraceae bacterium]
MQGKIIKGIAGFYYVHVVDRGVYECKAKGVFRNKKIKPLVGDNVEIEILSEEYHTGNITGILPRANQLVRPAVSNVDQALVIFAVAKPTPNFNLLDRFLIRMIHEGIPAVVCFNKSDVTTEENIRKLKGIYEGCGYPVLITSTYLEDGIDKLDALLEGKTTVLAGPSGVGKSSIINLISPEAQMETGSISRKIERGRHTTRHSELFCVRNNTYIMDTPGFSSIYVEEMEKEELREYFPEFFEYSAGCRFNGCQHINEPDCKVKEALANGKISKTRYDNYVLLYEELKNRKKY